MKAVLNQVGQFLVVNLFLLLVVLIGAGSFFAYGIIVRGLGLSGDLEKWGMVAVAVASIFTAYAFGKMIHAAIEKQLYKKR
jgi:hypothetical protein